MKKYLLSRLAEPSSWLAVAMIVSVLLFARWVTILLGVVLIVTGDTWLKNWVAKNAPGITASIDRWMQ
jgi:hypothetical protein